MVAQQDRDRTRPGHGTRPARGEPSQSIGSRSCCRATNQKSQRSPTIVSVSTFGSSCSPQTGRTAGPRRDGRAASGRRSQISRHRADILISASGRSRNSRYQITDHEVLPWIPKDLLTGSRPGAAGSRAAAGDSALGRTAVAADASQRLGWAAAWRAAWIATRRPVSRIAARAPPMASSRAIALLAEMQEHQVPDGRGPIASSTAAPSSAPWRLERCPRSPRSRAIRAGDRPEQCCIVDIVVELDSQKIDVGHRPRPSLPTSVRSRPGSRRHWPGASARPTSIRKPNVGPPSCQSGTGSTRRPVGVRNGRSP